MIWQLMGLTVLLTAGESFNKSIIFVPTKYQKEFTTPYWVRRAQCICFALMYICFVLTIFLPWFWPYVSKHSVPLSYFDDDQTDDGRVTSHQRRSAYFGYYKFTRADYAFGKYWVNDVTAYEMLCWTYFVWALVAVANSVLDYLKGQAISKAEEEALEKARASGIELNPIHNIAENNVGMMRRVVLSGHTGAQANLMGEYKLQTERTNGSPIFAMRSKNIEETDTTLTSTQESGSKLAAFGTKGRGTAYLYRTPEGGDGDGRWRVARNSFYGPSSAAAIESALPSELPTDPGVNFQVREHNMGKWSDSKITAVDVSTIAPPILILAGDTSMSSKVEARVLKSLGEGRNDTGTEGLFWGTYYLQVGRQVNGYPLYATEGGTEGWQNTFLYRSADGGNGDGRWRITRTETDIAKDGSVESMWGRERDATARRRPPTLMPKPTSTLTAYTNA